MCRESKGYFAAVDGAISVAWKMQLSVPLRARMGSISIWLARLQAAVYKPCEVMKVYAVRYLEDAAELSGALFLYDGSG